MKKIFIKVSPNTVVHNEIVIRANKELLLSVSKYEGYLYLRYMGTYIFGNARKPSKQALIEVKSNYPEIFI